MRADILEVIHKEGWWLHGEERRFLQSWEESVLTKIMLCEGHHWTMLKLIKIWEARELHSLCLNKRKLYHFPVRCLIVNTSVGWITLSCCSLCSMFWRGSSECPYNAGLASDIFKVRSIRAHLCLCEMLNNLFVLCVCVSDKICTQLVLFPLYWLGSQEPDSWAKYPEIEGEGLSMGPLAASDLSMFCFCPHVL